MNNQVLVALMNKLIDQQLEAAASSGEELERAENLWLNEKKIKPESLRKKWRSFLNRRDALIELHDRLGRTTTLPRTAAISFVLREDLSSTFGEMH